MNIQELCGSPALLTMLPLQKQMYTEAYGTAGGDTAGGVGCASGRLCPNNWWWRCCGALEGQGSGSALEGAVCGAEPALL